MAGFLQDNTVYWGKGTFFGTEATPPRGSFVASGLDPDTFSPALYMIGRGLYWLPNSDIFVESSETVQSLQTVAGSQTFTLEDTLGSRSETFRIEEITYPSGPSVGGAFNVVSTVFERTLSPGEFTEEITVELPAEMHIRFMVLASGGAERVLLMTAEGSEPAFWTNFIKATERPL